MTYNVFGGTLSLTQSSNQIVIISGQPRWACYKFSSPEPWLAGRTSLSWDRLCVWHSLPAALQTPEMTLHTFKRQLKAYLFHIWCVDEQKEHPPPPGAVVAFFMILALDTKLPTYLFDWSRPGCIWWNFIFGQHVYIFLLNLFTFVFTYCSKFNVLVGDLVCWAELNCELCAVDDGSSVSDESDTDDDSNPTTCSDCHSTSQLPLLLALLGLFSINKFK